MVIPTCMTALACPASAGEPASRSMMNAERHMTHLPARERSVLICDEAVANWDASAVLRAADAAERWEEQSSSLGGPD